MRDLGFDQMDIETITIVVEPPPQDAPILNYAVVLQMSKKIEQNELLTGFGIQFEEYPVPDTDQKLMIARDLFHPSYSLFDDKTLVIANANMFGPLLRALKLNENPNRDAIASQYQGHDIQAFLQVEPIRELSNNFLQQLEIPPIVGLSKVPDELDTVILQLNVLNKTELSLELKGKDEDAASHLLQLIEISLDVAEQQAMIEINKLLQSEDLVVKPWGNTKHVQQNRC